MDTRGSSRLAARRTTRSRAAAMLIAFTLAAPASGQDWGDSHYVPTPQSVVDKMLELGKVSPKDFVVDLGSGDGRIVITAARKFGARGFGIDIDPNLIRLSNQLASKAGVADRARFYERDLFAADISQASVVTVYLLPEVVLMIRSKILSMKPGTRIVAHDYDFGEWQPDHQVLVNAPDKNVGRERKSKIMYWVVPAETAGRWRGRITGAAGVVQEFELALQQMFQQVQGTLTVAGKSVAIENARLTGDRLAFAANLNAAGGDARYEFNGRIEKHALDGTVRVTRARAGAARQGWSAARTELWRPSHASLPPPPTQQPSADVSLAH